MVYCICGLETPEHTKKMKSVNICEHSHTQISNDESSIYLYVGFSNMFFSACLVIEEMEKKSSKTLTHLTQKKSLSKCQVR